LSSSETVSLAVTGTNITAGDYTLSNTTITIPSGASSGSVTFTVVDDVASEGTETATLTISNPSQGLLIGSTISQNIVISDNDNTAPTIAINIASTSNYIDGGIASSPSSPYSISATIGDATDPMLAYGIDFTVYDAETPVENLNVTVGSSNLSVVPLNKISLSGTTGLRNVKITPSIAGYSTITISVNDGLNTANYQINYACSDSIPKIVLNNTLWHTGISDASDAIELDNQYYLSADDEINVVNVYSRTSSGLPLVSYNFGAFLNLPDPAKPEIDTEAGARSPKNMDKVYWIGSMSNGKAPYDNKPNRDRLVATSITGTGANTSISFAGYAAIRSSLLSWGDAHGYNFTASAQAGVDSKSVSGFASEGMVFGPDSTTLWIGLRAPLVPTANRTKAVIAPILNFETWFNGGNQTGNPTYGNPIELNLGGRGIRDIIRLKNGSYIIVAGNSSGDPITSAIYKWSGNNNENPVLVNTAGNNILNMEGVMEVQDPNPSKTKLQIISDGGDAVLYNDGAVAKDQGNLNLRKFRSDLLTNIDLCLPKTLYINATKTSYCANSSTQLNVVNDPTIQTYSWSNGASTNAIFPSAFGTYTVTGTDKINCSYDASILLENCDRPDLDDNAIVNVNDFLLLIQSYGFTCLNCRADINKSGMVEVNDFLQLVQEFSQSCHCDNPTSGY
jgi:hypothetical protein